MITFFRKIRQNLLSEGKTGKYFKYAIGEILLVMVGILLALQVNNWNENRKAKTYEKQVYKQIYNDIVSDSLPISNTIDYFNQKDTLINRILFDSVPSIAYDTIIKENQRKFAYGIFLVTNYINITNTKKGYQLFKTFNTIEIETDSLSYYIERYYRWAFRIENFSSESLPNITSKNITELQQKDWFLDFSLNRRLNPGYLDYIKNSDDFKTRIWNYQNYAIKNYNRDLKQQQERAEQLKEKIKNRLEK